MRDPWNEYRSRIVKLANEQMRERYLTPDAATGATILHKRRKGITSEALFQLRQSWSPIAWEGKPGLEFEISELSFRALGEHALDPEIDAMVTGAAHEALAENHEGILQSLIQRVVDGDYTHFEVVE